MSVIYRDIPRLYTALAEWLACVVYLLTIMGPKDFIKRRSNILATVLFLGFQCIFMETTGGYNRLAWILFMMIAMAAMYAYLVIMLEGDWRTGGFTLARAFLSAEFAASLEWQIFVTLAGMGYDYLWVRLAVLVLVYALVFGIIYLMESRTDDRLMAYTFTRKDLLAALGVALIIFILSNFSFLLINTQFGFLGTGASRISYREIFNIRTLVDFIGVGILTLYVRRLGEMAGQQEMQKIRSMLNLQYKQYLQYQSSMEQLHILRHDLKHQIAGLRAESDAGKREAWLDAIEEELEKTNAVDPTGDQVLDSILTSKKMLMDKHKIHLTVVADGSLLQMFHVTDLCSIFGNIMDNAIESVIQLPEEEKRLIHLSVYSQKNFLYIEAANYCDTELIPDGKDSFKTTKANKRDHGYGLKSVRYAVEKYDGTLTTGVVNHWFELKILVPMQFVAVK